jgi:nucleoside-diphosphate-sugar epimerase
MLLHRVLITGAASPLGQAVARHFKSHSCYLVGVVRPGGNKPKTGLFDVLLSIDLTNRENVANIVQQYDAVVHIASLADGEPSHILRATALSTALLLERAEECKIPVFVHVSSLAVYGSVTTECISATSAIGHSNAFGAAKFAAESLVASVGRSIKGVSVRPPAIVGSTSHRHFLAGITRLMSQNVPTIRVLNPDFLSNNLVHEDTLSEFLVHLTLNPPKVYSAFPVSSSTPLALREVVERLAKITGYQGLIEWSTSLVPPFSINPTHAIHLGFEPLTMSQTLDQWFANGNPSID